ncbi:hypothetical protein [Pseudomonas monteilii]|uniref:hypothetical protein n=1 Tax=Pseudomonas monteilii TaxID=76759 RepID=UPI001E47C25E|nr:hypothetical protein [Pseudomonas monteilii]MCE0925991.1 hypothetical protein [Pseudomonas monteilii]MCE0934678.1 hypothetical protein [Pseudomonas monteilii]MCE0980973.1 hypothetical protein [Pseudomonas monteilii]MCE1012260.1 hypothetical protein [Pseudomonas monteilii]MCE1040966.1 hypothetical protein [Pseudomonas monteilii]
MSYRNKHGLGRTISAETKREVRKRCGFGCVRCGLGFYDYEHFAPDFAEARSHDPAGITLLCMQCNQKRNRNVLSAATVAAHNANPRCLQEGYANEWLDVSSESVEVVFAGSTFVDCTNILKVCGDNVLSILPPEFPGETYRISGLFADDTGATTLKIVDNQWTAGADNWDVEWVGSTLTIRKGPRDIVLVLKTVPPTKLIVERLNMQINGIHVVGDAEEMSFSRGGHKFASIGTCDMFNVKNAIVIE